MRQLSDFDGGEQTTLPRYSCVCTLFAHRAGVERLTGTAVLIAPDLAITASHCVKYWQPNLSVRLALDPRRTFEVTGIIWEPGNDKKSTFHFGNSHREYPDGAGHQLAEGIVLLKLSERVPIEYCALYSADGLDVGSDVDIAAADPLKSGFVRYATLRIRQIHDRKFDAVEHGKGGFARASGAPVLTVDKSAGQSLRATVAGIQSAVHNYGAGPAERVADVLLLTPERVQWITGCLNHNVLPNIEVGPSPSTPRRYIVVRERDLMVLSGADILLEHSDPDFYHGKVWNLLGCGTLGLLTSNGLVVTSRCDEKSAEHRMDLFTFQRRKRAEFSLVPGGHDNVDLWLHGWVCFDSRLVHVYLYRVDGTCADPGPEGKIRIEAFESKGPYEDHVPDLHLVVFLRPGESIEAARQRAATFFANRKLGLVVEPDPLEFLLLSSPAGYVQDDVANGHEGHNPP